MKALALSCGIVDLEEITPEFASSVSASLANKQVPTTARTTLLSLPSSPNEWVLVASPTARIAVNGVPLAAGLRVLRHRDHLRWDGNEWSAFLATDEVAHVETFVGSDGGFCPRCRSEIRAGENIVRCPHCAVVHHETADGRNCWTYSSTCAACSYPTAGDGLLWTPEEL